MAITEIGQSGNGKLVLGERALEVQGPLRRRMSIPFRRISSVETSSINILRVETGAKKHRFIIGMASIGKLREFADELNDRIARSELPYEVSASRSALLPETSAHPDRYDERSEPPIDVHVKSSELPLPPAQPMEATSQSGNRLLDFILPGLRRYWRWCFGPSEWWTKVLAWTGVLFLVISAWNTAAGGPNEVSTTEESGGESVSRAVKAAPTPDNRLAKITQSFRDGFGMPGFQADWYGIVDGLEISGKTLVVRTRLYEDAEGRRFAKPICSAASNYAFANDATEYRLNSVRVTGKSGQSLAYRGSLSQSC